MDNHLNKVYANPIDKELKNTQETFYSQNRNSNIKQVSALEINNKIKQIFLRNNYVYQTKVSITLENEEITATLIGKNNQYIITKEHGLIKISDIIDIK